MSINIPDNQREMIMGCIQEIHAEVHSKVDLYDVNDHEKGKIITFEKQINLDLHETLKEYDELLIELKASILDQSIRESERKMLTKINDQYGRRVKDHDRSHLCALQQENEKEIQEDSKG
jgi:hypothetical protein